MARHLLPLLSLAGILSWTASSRADVVQPPPSQCPEGQTPSTDHGGPYCKPPPPTNCAPNQRPRVHRDLAYCEPPPSKGCAPGSFWTSTSPTDTYCQAARRCESSPCGAGSSCTDSALCVRLQHFGRGAIEVVTGTCQGGAACAQGKCVEAKRCQGEIVQTDSSAEPTASAAPSASAEPSAEPAASAAPSAEPTASAAPSAAPAPSAPPAAQSGCGGCSLQGSERPTAAWLLLGLALLAARRRLSPR